MNQENSVAPSSLASGSLCNDIAVGTDGTAYVKELSGKGWMIESPPIANSLV